MDKIDGEVLLGFGDYFSTDDVSLADSGYEIGAAKPAGRKTPPAGKKSAGGAGKPQIRQYPKPRATTAMKSHGKVLTGARNVATKAAQTIGRALQLLSRKPAAVRTPPGSKPALSRALSSTKRVVIGADVAATLTPKQKLAVQKRNDAVAKSNKSAKVLAQHALKTKAAIQGLAKRIVAQKKMAKLLRTPAKKRPKGRVHVGELLADPVIGAEVAQAFQDYYDTVGAYPDPDNVGQLDDGSPDPAAATDPTAGLEGFDLGPLTEDPLDSGAEMPPPPSMDTFIADMNVVGGIAYDGSKGTPDGYVLSYGLATRRTDRFRFAGSATVDGTDHYGYVWGRYDLRDPANGGIPWGSNLKPDAWNHVHGFYLLGTSREGWQNIVEPSEAFSSNSKTSPWGGKYGPLIGNPAMKDFVGMRVDAQGNMFWLPQEAPDWLTFPIKQAAALTAQAAAKAAREANAAAAAAENKARADEASAKAAQDAANALAESAAASTAKITKGEEEVKQVAAETAAQQAIVQQQQAEIAERGIETEQTKQAGELMLSRTRREQEYLAAHPEIEFAPPPSKEEDQGAYLEDSDTMDDGEPLPGGDLMQDSGGEGFQDDDEQGDEE